MFMGNGIVLLFLVGISENALADCHLNHAHFATFSFVCVVTLIWAEVSCAVA
jgi:hypothetical protein